MFRSGTVVVSALLLSAISGPAQAATEIGASGSFETGEQVYFSDWRDDLHEELFMMPVGKYRFDLKTSTSVEGFGGAMSNVMWSSMSCKIDGIEHECSYNDWVEWHELTLKAPNRYSTRVNVTNKIVRFPDDPCYEGDTGCWTDIVDYQNYYCCGAQFSFIAPKAGTFTLSATAVPEPATWMMMLLGFGGVGGAVRSAKRSQRLIRSYA